MRINVKNIVSFFSKTPKLLFLLDGLGAALTTFSLFFVLRPFSSYFGMPTYILTNLSVIGLVFCVYSMACYFFLKGNRAPFLRAIAIGNFLYCVLTITLLYLNYNGLTQLGVTYFGVEIVVIVLLVYIELKTANALKAA